jgi:hypothetical protein
MGLAQRVAIPPHLHAFAASMLSHTDEIQLRFAAIVSQIIDFIGIISAALPEPPVKLQVTPRHIIAACHT